MEKLRKLIQESNFYIVIGIMIIFALIIIIQSFSLYSIRVAFEKDSNLKSIQIQRLDAGISFETKRRQFLIIARDSILKKHNPELSNDEAYNMAEYTLYICEK